GPGTIGVLQDCIYASWLFRNENTNINLEFITEPEAVALYCMDKLGEHLLREGSTFTILDCGDGTVDLTTRKLLTPMSDFKENHYHEYQYLIHHFFCPGIKFGFDGDSFEATDLDIGKFCPALKEYITKDISDKMGEEYFKLLLKYEKHEKHVKYKYDKCDKYDDSNVLDKIHIPDVLDYRKAITDYLKELKPVNSFKALSKRWPTLKFPSQVRLVFTVPAEWSPGTIGVLQESEAAALYCVDKSEENSLKEGSVFMVVDCGGGTVDLTTRKLLISGTLSEMCEQTGDFCGSTYVDDEFIAFLKINLDLFGFDGDSFESTDLEIGIFSPYVTDDELRKEMEEEDWLLEITYKDVLAMFDPVVNKIIRLIRNQLEDSKEKCSAMYLTGGFSESPYLISKIRKTFLLKVPTIIVPQNPITAVVRGGVIYGLDKKAIVCVYIHCVNLGDPIERKTKDGRIYKFHCLAKCGIEYTPNQEFSGAYYPVYPDQKGINFKVYCTPKNDQEFCNESGMELIGELYIELPDVQLKLDRSVEFSLMFGELLINASAWSKKSGKACKTTFHYAKRDVCEASFLRNL
ncbi:4579_t:CDS:10, partial [Entrophospora sp. SA101]